MTSFEKRVLRWCNLFGMCLATLAIDSAGTEHPWTQWLVGAMYVLTLATTHGKE